MRAGRLLLCLPLLTAASGCGFLFVHGPPTGHEQLEYIPCTEGQAGPVLDLIWGGLNVLGAAIIASTPDDYPDPGLSVASGLTWGVVSGFSAASGFKKSSACTRARQALAQRQAARGTAPFTLGADSARVMAVVITPAADTLAVGEQLQLMAAARSSSGALAPGRMFTWSSSNDAIASVSNAGLVTAHAAGSVIIAANTNNVVGTAALLITAPR